MFSLSVFAVLPMLLSFCWSMDVIEVLQAPAFEQLVQSFPDRMDGGRGRKYGKWDISTLPALFWVGGKYNTYG